MGTSSSYDYNSYTINRLKKAGYRYGKVEFYNQYARVSVDFCGFADYLAFHPTAHKGVLAVNSTSGTHFSEHLLNYTQGKPRDAIIDWLLAGNHFELWAWDKRSQREEDGSFKVSKSKLKRGYSKVEARLPKQWFCKTFSFSVVDHDLGVEIHSHEFSILSTIDIPSVAKENKGALILPQKKRGR